LRETLRVREVFMVEIACLYPNALGSDLSGLRRCRELGYEAVQLHPGAFVPPAGRAREELSAETPLGPVLEAVGRAELRIAGWSGYRPLIGSGEAVEGHIAYLSELLRLAGRAAREAPALTQPIVCTETGAPDPKRPSGEPGGEEWTQLVGSLRRLATVAEEAGAKVAIEPTRLDIIRDAGTAEKVIDEVGSHALGVCYDPANVICQGEALSSTFATLELHIFISHAKDVRFAEDGSVAEYPPAGKGVLDYEEFFLLLGRLPSPHTLAVEYARSEEELQRVAAFLRRLRG
jgi:sugar phosphate isomerase/epimerase